jgi:hypothetical protein
MESEYYRESRVSPETSAPPEVPSVSNKGISAMQGAAETSSETPAVPRPDNPETPEVSRQNKEAAPGRDDGLSAVPDPGTSTTAPASDDDQSSTPDPTTDATAPGRRRIQETLNPPVEAQTPSEAAPPAARPFSSRGMSAMQGEYDPADEVSQTPDLPPVSPALPNTSSDSANISDWKNLGIVDVPVSALPDPDVKSSDDFNHNISWEDAKKRTLELPSLQRDVAAGKVGDDFSAEDEAAGRSYTDPEGRRRLFDLYYGSQPIKLAKDGDNYFIDGGNHRIFAAKELGLETIPARVKEKQHSGVQDSTPSTGLS